MRNSVSLRRKCRKRLKITLTIFRNLTKKAFADAHPLFNLNPEGLKNCSIYPLYLSDSEVIISTSCFNNQDSAVMDERLRCGSGHAWELVKTDKLLTTDSV